MSFTRSVAPRKLSPSCHCGCGALVFHTRIREWNVGFSIWSLCAVARRGALVARFFHSSPQRHRRPRGPASLVPDGIIARASGARLAVGCMGGAGFASSSLGQRVLAELLAGGIRLLRAPSGQ